MFTSYSNCQNLINIFAPLKMATSDDTANDACFSPSNASPSDFDFNLPCRFYKSSFARSLSLDTSSNNGSNKLCKSLDYDNRSNNNSSNNNNNNGNKLPCLKKDVTAVPPLLQRRYTQAGSFYQQNEANITSDQKQVFAETTATKIVFNEEEKPPALPARRPLSLHNLTLPQKMSVNECQMNAEHKFQQNVLTQLRQQAYKQATNVVNNNSIMPVNGNKINNVSSGYNRKNYTDHDTGLQLSPQQHQPILSQKPQPHHFTASGNKNASSGINSCNSSSVNNNCDENNFGMNRNNNNIISNNKHNEWPNQQNNVEQDINGCPFDQSGGVAVEIDELFSNYHDAEKVSTKNCNNHFHNSHQILNTIPTANDHRNPLQPQQQQQNTQQQHQTSSHEISNDNSSNVEALILQNQVDTLQWQLKQVETSRNMHRAVMEEVARFLERYQSQKKDQQLQQQQQQQQMTAHKHCNSSSNNNDNNSKLEQIPRSKSLFQVYVAGGRDKSANGNSDVEATTSKSISYLRARSSTNLKDLKQQSTNIKSSGKSKDKHIFEPDLPPSQTYSAFKDFTWRRSPKKTSSRSNTAKDDVEEKLNQDAIRLLRTIQNLLNISHHQADFANHRLSLGYAATLQEGRLSKATSTASVLTLPGPPTLNSSVANGNDAATNTNNTSDTSTATLTAPTSVDNAASNNLAAPEMLFLRSANMRDSRISLRSTTDSSVHSTSSASSKVETDDEPTNMLAHKQHHHLAGSSTEDESGFSSISSFPDIGVPLNSTFLSNSGITNGKSRLIGKELKSLQANEKDSLASGDSRQSTLKANIVGLPLNSSQDTAHRWDSPSKTYHNASNKFQKFSALTNEDSNTVLWV